MAATLPLTKLRENPVYAQAEGRALEALLAASSLVRYRKGHGILREGEPADRVYSLVSGRVRIYHLSPSGGEEVVVTLMGAPAIFGEAEAFSGIAHLEYVDAAEPCAILVSPVEAMLRFLRQAPSACFAFMVDLATRLTVASYNERSFTFHPSTLRLANYLLDYAQWTNEGRTDAPWRIDLSQRQMAAAIGVTRRSVAKDIAQWRDEGILRVERDHYLVDDLAGLRRYADAERLSILHQIKTPRALRED